MRTYHPDSKIAIYWRRPFSNAWYINRFRGFELDRAMKRFDWLNQHGCQPEWVML